MDSPDTIPDWLRALSPHVDSELVGDFVQECSDHIQRIEAALLHLETEPEDTTALHAVFRAFHTVKGTAAFLGFTRIAELAHRTESLLSRMRDGDLRCTGGYADLVFRATDVLKEYTRAIQEALHGSALQVPEGLEALLEALGQYTGPGASVPTTDLYPMPRLGDILVAEGKVARQAVESVAAGQSGLPIGIALVRAGTASLPDVAQALRTQRLMSHDAAGASDATVRVRLDHLDSLLDLLGELVIAQNIVAQDNLLGQQRHRALRTHVTHVSQLVRHLHTLSLAMRMVPLKATLQKMQRVARDVAHRQGKLVAFSAVGEETEIDRNLAELLTDPLLHMVRNAIDHGLEPPAVREQLGKPRLGQVSLKAYNTGQHTIIEVRDDGRGLACDKIVAKARALGLITPAQVLTEQEVYRLILTPGFSTADEVTDISGRGVGMDVVWQSIQAMHGQLDVASQAGHGTTFVVSLPRRLAISDGIVAQVGGERYVLLSSNVVQNFRPPHATLWHDAAEGEMVSWGEEDLPLVRLHRLFAVPGAVEEPWYGLLVVLQGDTGQRYALLVDTLLGPQQVIMKPLGPGLGPIQGIAGATILSDGCVGLILDPAGLLALARQPAPSEDPRIS